jgi:hypothetical protein
LNSQWVVEEIKGEIKKFPRIRWKWKHNVLEPLRHC